MWGFPCNSKGFLAHCVSRAVKEDLAYFLNENNDFETHYVSRDLPVDLAHRLATGCGLGLAKGLGSKLSPEPVFSVVVRISASPVSTVPSMTLFLAFGFATDVLAIADLRMW